MKRSDRGSTTPVGSLLKQVLGQHPAFAANPIGDWKELVGEQVARYTSPRSLKEGVLVVVAHDSVWKHHLEQYKELLAEKINEKRPKPLVEKIVIKVAGLPEADQPLNPAHKNLEKIKAKRSGQKKKSRTPARKLTPDEQALIKGLPDADLREIGAKLLKRIPLEDDLNRDG